MLYSFSASLTVQALGEIAILQWQERKILMARKHGGNT